MPGLLFLNDLLEDMSVDSEPKSSGLAATEGVSRRSASPREEADRDTDLEVSPVDSRRGVGVKSLHDRCSDKSCPRVRVSVFGDALTVAKV